MNSHALRRDAAKQREFGRDKIVRFFNPLAAKLALNTAALLECVADLNDRVRVLEGGFTEADAARARTKAGIGLWK
jgi:hypothetical protein